MALQGNCVHANSDLSLTQNSFAQDSIIQNN